MNKTQSLAGYIREHLSSYEERLAIGIRQEVIVKELAEAGYETNVFTLRTLLSRARKKRDKQLQKAAGPAPALPAGARPVEAKPAVKKQDNPLTKPAGFDAQALKNSKDSDLI